MADEEKSANHKQRKEIKVRPGYVPVAETPRYTLPAKRRPESFWYKLVGNRYEIVPHSGQEGLWG